MSKIRKLIEALSSANLQDEFEGFDVKILSTRKTPRGTSVKFELNNKEFKGFIDDNPDIVGVYLDYPGESYGSIFLHHATVHINYYRRARFYFHVYDGKLIGHKEVVRLTDDKYKEAFQYAQSIVEWLGYSVKSYESYGSEYNNADDVVSSDTLDNLFKTQEGK